MKIQDRILRRDFGHLDMQVTIDDPITFTRPVTIQFPLRPIPDSDILESF